MKVGEYCRTDKGKIGKIVHFEPRDKYPYSYDRVILDTEGHKRTTRNIIKCSENIIDLIEEGDILKVNDFKDVYTIYEVEMFRNPYTNEKYLGIRNDIGKRPKRLYEIPLVNLSIVTKEQFEQISYKVGD